MPTTKNKWDTKPIALKNLSLWDENSRFPDYLGGGNESELIEVLLNKYDLENFAEEIVKDFDLPQLEKIVVYKKGNKFIVLEGNRRVGALKSLLKPALIDDEVIRRKFEILKDKIGISGNLKIEAVTTSSKEEGMRYIERKHYLLNNEKNWGEYERHNHIKRTRDPSSSSLPAKEARSIFRANIGDMVKRVALPENLKHDILGKGFVTTFYRIVDSNAGRKKLRYERSSDNNLLFDNEKESLLLLKVIIFNILAKKTLKSKDLNSRSLNSEKAIRKYLDSISVSDVREVDRLITLQKNEINTEEKKKKKISQVSTPPVIPIPVQKRPKYSLEESMNIIRFISQRFPDVSKQLLKRYNNRDTIKIEDEYDVQDLFMSLLRLFFFDVRKEENGPTHAGGASRMDILLKSDQIGIEVKMTRSGLETARKVGDQLLLDIPRYRKYPNCKFLFCFVFDPQGKINNPVGLETDIREESSPRMDVDILVV